MDHAHDFMLSESATRSASSNDQDIEISNKATSSLDEKSGLSEDTPQHSEKHKELKVNVISVAEQEDKIPDVKFDGEFVPEKSIFGGSLRGSLVDFWWQEMIAIAVMLLSLGAIILILALYDNEPLPHWPLKININSLVSIFNTIMKATMLAILAAGIGQHKWLWFRKKARPLAHFSIYDKAGQGPSYASQMLFILGGKQIFACLALGVIIVSMALDPFTQQVIGNRQVVRPKSTGVVTIPRTSVYDQVGYHAGAGSSTMDNHMLSAIMAGLYTPGTDFGTLTAAGCTTGNCTFPKPYTTLEVCGACIDMTDTLVGTCFDNTTTYNNTYIDENNVTVTEPDTETIQTYNFSLPTGSMVQLPILSPFEALLQASQSSNYNYSSEFKNDARLIYRDFIYQSLLNGSVSPGIPQTCGSCSGKDCGMSAASCKIYPCLNTYTATIVNTSMVERLVTSSALNTTDVDGNVNYGHLNKACLSAQDKAYLTGKGIDANNYQDWIPYPVGGEEYQSLNVTSDCFYDFSNISLFSFNYLDSTFNFMQGVLSGMSAVAPVGNSDLVFMYDSGDFGVQRLEDTFRSIATTMSARMRVSGDPLFSKPAEGIVYQNMTVIHVRWLWLILPIALVTITLLFAIVTMRDTSTRGRKPVGKAFNLGLLLSGVAGQVTDEVDGNLKYVHQVINRFSDMKHGHDEAVKSAQALHVQFKETEDGWRLIKI